MAPGGGGKPVNGSYNDTKVLTKATLNEKLHHARRNLFRGWLRHLDRFLQKTKSNSTDSSSPGKTAKRPGLKPVVLKSGLTVVAFLIVVALGIKQISFSRSQPDAAPTATVASVVEDAAENSRVVAAKAALKAKDYAQAVILFEEIFSGNPSLKDNLSAAYVSAALGQAADILDTDPRKAEILILKALQVDPDNISGLSNLGYIYMSRQNYEKAVETYLKVTTLAPRLPDTFFNLGYVYAVTSDYQQAKVMYRRVVELKPAFTDEALFNLAVINEKLGEHEQCIKNLEQAVALNPGNESASKYLQQLKKKAGDKKG